MKVYRIKHKSSGLFASKSFVSRRNKEHWITKSKTGNIYIKKCPNFSKFESDPDYEILYDEIKD